jgi:hypothetical protein
MMMRGNEVGEGRGRGMPGNGALPPWIIRVHDVGEGPTKVVLPPWIIKVHEVAEGPGSVPEKAGVPP